jgi:hypothetical protein
LLTERQVEQSNQEEAMMDPAVHLQQIRTEHGTKTAELDRKITQLENELREEIAHVSTVSSDSVPQFRDNVFKQGIDTDILTAYVT